MKKKKDSHIISTTENLNRQKVPRIDFEILTKFYELCRKKKISEREISFLIGKPQNYFQRLLLTESEKFLEHSQDYRIWISSYVPLDSSSSNYFIWYEDADENDKLLTFNDGKVLLSLSIDGLLSLLINNNDLFKAPVNLEAWLSRTEDLPPTASAIYSPKEIIVGFEADPVSVDTLTDFVDFYNLVGDLGYQDEMFKALLEFRKAGELTKVWDYYCDNHLFKAKKQKELSFDRDKFIADLRELVERFEGNMLI